jgi:hypothetical protein
VPELDFAGLREQLERETRQPGFGVIRARRVWRTARWAVGGAVVTLVAVLAGAAGATGYLRHGPGPVTPIGTPTVSTSPTPAASPSPSSSPLPPAPVAVTAMAAAPSGELFAAARRCVSDCLAAATYVDVLLHGGDLGAAPWTVVGDLPAGMGTVRLLAAGGTRLWLVGDGEIAGSTDGGHTWQRWSLAGSGGPYAGLAGGTAWIARDGAVAVAVGGGRPAPTATQPPGAAHISGLAALGADRAAVLTGEGPGAWYVTTDRGAHWSPLADPCAGTRYPGSLWSTVAGAPDGTLWAVCASPPATGQQPKQLVTSVDGGRTWLVRGDLESAGYGTSVYPYSATVAWRTGGRADLYRTADAAHWTAVAVTGDAAGGGDSFFTALGSDSGVYVQDGAVYSTVDGGRTWQRHPLPAS